MSLLNLVREYGSKLPIDQKILILGCTPQEVNEFSPYTGNIAGMNIDEKICKECPQIKKANFNEKFPFESGAFDYAFSANIFDFLKNPIYFFSELYRILSYNGMSFHEDKVSWNYKEIAETSGFDVKIPNYQPEKDSGILILRKNVHLDL